jgi:hypothetical protein
MNIYFLEAKVPLTKTFRPDGTSDQYPLISKFTSSEVSVASIEDLYDALVAHSQKGHCLLKGALSRPLVNESRAGATDPDAPTQWICIDIDGLTAYKDLDAWISTTPLADVSHIVNWSASSGLKPGIRAHVLVLLAAFASPATIKAWLKSLNLGDANISGQLGLTRAKAVIKWVIDPTVAQNDKLIYTTAPVLIPPLADPHPGLSRYVLNLRTQPSLTLPPIDVESVRAAETKKTNELRALEGLPAKRTHSYVRAGQVEYLSKPGVTAEVTGVKKDRGYTYLNLNGGDSWGYYHPDNVVEFLYNFKGEPTYKLKEICPDYYSTAVSELQSTPDKTGRVFLAFREFRTGQYWNGVFVADNNSLSLAAARSTQQLDHFMAQYQAPWDGVPKDWSIEYAPSKAKRVDFDQRIVNTYEAPGHAYDPNTQYTLPPITKKVIEHVCGDVQIAQIFINWLAYIVQTKQRPSTAWLFHGTQGTGKGLLANFVLPALLGRANTALRRQSELEERFNSYLEGKMVVVVDEVQMGALSGAKRINSDIKNYITEDTITIRRMRVDGYSIPNTCSLIFCSNMPDPVILDETDRRMHMGAYQPNKLQITQAEVVQLEKEAEQLNGYLLQFAVDPDKARYPQWTEAKKNVLDLSLSGPEVLARAIKAGDFAYFVDQLPDTRLQTTINREVQLKNYEATLRGIARRGNHLTRDEAHTLFVWTQGTGEASTTKFATYLKHLRLELKKIRIDGQVVTAIPVNWNVLEADKARLGI